jgi:catechol 2,3-dioxygenase-like lactoylglutathione lyase family enzyme
MGLSDCKVTTAIAVTDMGNAKEFYEGKLGLSGSAEAPDGGIDYACGDGSQVHVYPSASAGGSGATIAFWETNDVDGLVDELSSAGISFEQYDTESLKTNEKGIAEFENGDKGAWFKDPDGNVMAVGNPTS